MDATATKRVRTCVTCGAKQDKVALHRIVRTKDGEVLYDGTGRKPGRGAYVCSAACLDKALCTGKLNRSLRMSLSAAQIEELRGSMAGLGAAGEAGDYKEQ